MRRLPQILSILAFGVLPEAVATAQPAPPPPVAPAPPADPAAEAAPPAAEPAPPPVAPPAPAPAVLPAPVVTPAAEAALAAYEPSSVQLGGYLQPQYRMRQDSPAQFDQDGFRFARARLIVHGETRAGNLQLSASIEAEMQPTFAMLDAYVSVTRVIAVAGKHALPGKLTLDAGQMRVPISRQNQLSDSRLSFVDKAQVATIAPDRDLGARLTAALPALPIRVIAGAFDGDGKNQVENINQSYLFAARVEVSPFGRDVPLAESAFGGRFLTLGLSYGHNTLTRDAGHELVTYLGADLAGAWKGLSGAFEYLVVRHTFEGAGDPTTLPDKFHANGWAAQLAYLLPVKLAPLRQARLELGVRVEEIDRNDTTPIAQLGDPNQSVRALTGVLSYYLRMHSLKAQLAATHFTEIEDRTAIGGDASYKNDQLLLQVTYRLE